MASNNGWVEVPVKAATDSGWTEVPIRKTDYEALSGATGTGPDMDPNQMQHSTAVSSGIANRLTGGLVPTMPDASNTDLVAGKLVGDAAGIAGGSKLASMLGLSATPAGNIASNAAIGAYISPENRLQGAALGAGSAAIPALARATPDVARGGLEGLKEGIAQSGLSAAIGFGMGKHNLEDAAAGAIVPPVVKGTTGAGSALLRALFTRR